MTELTFKERFSAAMADVAYVQRDGENSHFHYTYVSEAEVKRVVSEALRKHGLMIYAVGYEPIGECSGKSTTLRCSLTVGDVKGAEFVTAQAIGSGTDSSDKAGFKAMAGALKYCLTQLFLIATGDDPEREDEKSQTKGGKKSTSDDKPAKSTNDDTSAEPDAVVKLTADVAACKTLADLAKLKVAVSKLRGEPGFDELADAFKAKGAALKAAETKEAA